METHFDRQARIQFYKFLLGTITKQFRTEIKEFPYLRSCIAQLNWILRNLG